MPAMIANFRVRSSTVWSCVRSDSTDLLNCSFADCSSRFSRRSFDSSCVCDRDVKYWIEKNVDRQREEVTIEIREKNRRCETFNFRNLARACGTKMIVEQRLSIPAPTSTFRIPDLAVVGGYCRGRRGSVKPVNHIGPRTSALFLWCYRIF